MSRNMKQKIHNMGRASDFMIRIKSGSGSAVKGKIEHIHTGEVQYFSDFLELVLLMQHKLDENGYPQSDTELRSFSLGHKR